MEIFTLSEVFEVLVLDVVVDILGITVQKNTFENVFGSLGTANLAEVLKDEYNLILIQIVFTCQ